MCILEFVYLFVRVHLCVYMFMCECVYGFESARAIRFLRQFIDMLKVTNSNG